MGHTVQSQRKLSLIIVLALVATATTAPAAEAAHTTAGGDYPAYGEDFQSMFTGYPLDYCSWWLCTNWKEYPDQSPSRYVIQAEDDNRYVANPAKYGTADTVAYYTPRNHDSYLTNSFAGSFRAKMNASANTSWSSMVFLADGSKIDSTTGALNWWQGSVVLRFASTGRIYALGNTGYQPIGWYDANEWVTLDVDFHGDGTYDVCVNGKPAKSDIPYYSAPTSGIDTVGLSGGGSTYRTVDTGWDDLLYVPTPQDFCLDYTPDPVEQDFWNFEGVGSLYTDDQIRMAAVEAFMDCTKQVNANRGSLFYPYHGCPYTVAEWETVIRQKIEDAAAERAKVLPHIPRPTNEAPAPIPRPSIALDGLMGVSATLPAVQAGPPLETKPKPTFVAGPDVPGVPKVPLQPGPTFPTVVPPEPVMGPALPPVPTVTTMKGPTLTLPEMPAVVAEPVVITPPETPGTDSVVVPLRDHDFEPNWTVSMTPEKMLDLVLPLVPALPEVEPAAVSTAETLLGAAGVIDVQAPRPTLHPDVEPAPPVESPDFLRWMKERQDLIDYLNESWGLPDYRDEMLVPPVLFEIHTESRGQVKRTPALPLVPALINVDNNPTTGLLGLDVAVIVSFTPLLNEVTMNVTRLAPWERNMPNLNGTIPKGTGALPDDPALPGDGALPETPGPIADAVGDARDALPGVDVVDPYPGGVLPGTPLDLTAYALVPIPMPWPVETIATQNPDAIMVGVAGFTSGGNDAPASAQVGLAADSLLPLHPNSRLTLSLKTHEALDNFTLLGGVADARRTLWDEHDIGEALEPALDNASAAYEAATGAPFAIPDPAKAWYDILVDSTAYQTGYAYDADNATLASVSFQPPPDEFTVDVTLPTQDDENQVVTFTGETSSDVRVVLTTERDLLSEPERDVVNVRADKFPTSLTITTHEDPYLPSAEIDYDAEHAIGRIHVVTGRHVVFPEDDASWSPGAMTFHLEGARDGTADDVFHLNVSDLPDDLTFRTEDGDVRLDAAAPIGRIAITSATGESPILPAGGDGIHYESEGDVTRLGLVLRGLQAFSAIVSADVKTLRWELVGDRPFAVNLSLGDDVTGQDVRALVTNLPPVMSFHTDAASFAYLETSDVVRGIDAYVTDHSSGFEALVGIDDLPETIQARFNFTDGELSLDAAAPIRGIDATARLGASGSGLDSVRLRIRDLPSFKVAWDVDGTDVDATFDAGGDGIGLLEFQGGGDALVSIPSLADADHAYVLEDAHPDAPLAIGARITGLRHVGAHASADAYSLRAEHKRPEDLTLVLDQAGLEVLSRIEPVPTTVSVDVDLGANLSATYEATEVIDRIVAWVRQGTLEGELDVRLIPTRIDVTLEDDGAGGLVSEIRNQGRLGSMQAQFHDTAKLFGTQWTRAYARLEGVPEEVTVRVSEGGVGFEAAPGTLSLVEAAVTNAPALVLLTGDHVRLRGDAAGDTVEASARVTGLRLLDASFVGDLRIRVENDHARPFTAEVDYPHLGIAGVVTVQDLPAVLNVETNLVDTHLYEASSVIQRVDAYANIGGLETWLGLDDVPARVKVHLNTTAEGIEAFVLSSSRLQEARADVHDPLGVLGTPWTRAYAKVQGLPEVLSLKVGRTGPEVAADFSTEHDPIALVEGAASSAPDLTMLAGDHLMFTHRGSCLQKDIGAFDHTGGECLESDALSFRLRGLEGARATVSPTEVAARVETADERSFTAWVDTPDVTALAEVSNVPEVVDFRSDLANNHTYTASRIIDSIHLAGYVAGTSVDVLVRQVPESVSVTLTPGADSMEVRAVSSSRLGEFRVFGHSASGIFGTPWQWAHARILGVPEETTIHVGDGGVTYTAGPGALTLAEAAVSADAAGLAVLPGDHVLIVTDAAGGIHQASGRIEGLTHAAATFGADGFEARLETTRPAPFAAYAVMPDLDLTAYVTIHDLPAVIDVSSNLKDRHVYEASSVIDRIDAYARIGTLETWIGLDDVPARVKVLLNATDDGVDGFVLSSSRLQEARMDVRDATGIQGTPWTRAYAKVQGLPEVLSFRADGAGAEFSTEHDLVALVEGAATTGTALRMLPGDHVAYASVVDYRTCELQDGGECPTTEDVSFRLRGLEGARASFAPDDVTARIETRDARNFTALVDTPELYACLLVEPLPTVVDVRARIPNDILYDASSIIGRVALDAYVNGTSLHAQLLDVPRHAHVVMNATAEGGEVRAWTDTPLRDVLLDAYAPGGLAGTEWQRLRAHVSSLPRELTLDFDGAGAELGTGGASIGLVEFWAATSATLTELAGDHLHYQDVCIRNADETDVIRTNLHYDGHNAFPTGCGKAASGRITGLTSARYSLTDVDGLSARLEKRDPRVFRVLYRDQDDWETTAASVVVDELPAVLSLRTDLENRFVYEASGIVNEIVVTGQRTDNATSLTGAARLRNLPTRVEVTQDFTDVGGTARYVTDGHLGLIEIEVLDWRGLQDTAFTRAVARVEALPSLMEVSYEKSADRTLASFVTNGDGIGLAEVGLTTGWYIPVPKDNGVYAYKDLKGATETFSGRLHGLKGATARLVGDNVSADVEFRAPIVFEVYVYDAGKLGYLLVDAVPRHVSLYANFPSNVVYDASSAVERIVAYVEEPLVEGARILRGDLTTLPARVRFTLDEENGIAHIESSEAIGGIKLQIWDPEMTIGFHNVFAEIKHVPSKIRVHFDDPFQVDLSEGVDTIVFKATALGTYPVFDENHVSVRDGMNFKEEERRAFSVKAGGLKFAEVASRPGFTLAEARFRESQSLRAYYEKVDPFGAPLEEYLVKLTNVPKDVKFQLIEGGTGSQGTILYDASERVGGLEFAVVKDVDDYYNLTFANLPSELEINWRFGTDVPWFIRYVSDAPTEVHFDMPTSLGPLVLEALIQNFQWSILEVPSLIPDVSIDVDVSLLPPDVDINLELKWTFVLGTDTDFLPNHARLSLGLFHSDDFDLALTLTGDLTAQDWLYEASIRVRIGTDTGIDFPFETVGGHAYAKLCAGVYVRYDPLGLDQNFDCVLELGGTFP